MAKSKKPRQPISKVKRRKRGASPRRRKAAARKGASASTPDTLAHMAPGAPFQITQTDIKLLSPDHMASLLWTLVYLELGAHKISKVDADVPLSIYVPDGGIDGIAKWSGGSAGTPMIPSRHVGFQSKAEDSDKARAVNELLTRQKTLKPEVRKLLEAGGDYILFFKGDVGAKGRDARATAMVDAIRTASTRNGGKKITNPSVRLYGASKIAAWVNEYPAAIAAVDFYLGRRNANAQGWWEVSGYSAYRNPYIAGDEKRDEAIALLRSETYGAKSLVRLVGMSGLGKTRLVLEAFRPTVKGSSRFVNALTATFCYIRSPDGNTPQQIAQWRNAQKAGLVIVDNCPIELHNRLAEEIRHENSRLALLTIGNDLDVSAYAGTACKVIALEPVKEEVIAGLLAGTAYERLSSDDKQFIIKKLAQGFPMMALLVARAKLEAGDVTSLIHSDVLAKLLGEDVKRGSDLHKIVSVCSLFEYLGVRNELQDEYDIARKLCCPAISKDAFYAGVVHFQDIGIIAPYGRVVQVRPAPLALRLAADWWKHAPPDFVQRIVTAGWNEGMVNALCERVRMLDFVPELRESTKDMCGPNGPFGQAEVLLSELGSRLFRAIAEVNPEVATEALARALDPLDRAAVLAIRGDVRRNFVWSLEKIAFNGTIFSKASLLLAKLGSAENEKWSNNATGVFERLFQILASGTQADLATRMSVLKQLLEEDEPTMRGVAVKGLANALRSSQFMGTSGPEYQGSRKLKEYRPAVYGEIFTYWREALELLSEVASADDLYAEEAATAVAGEIRGLVQQNRLDDLESAIKKIGSARKHVWPQALTAIRDSLRFEGTTFPKEKRTRVESWIAQLTPNDLSSRLNLLVTQAPYEHEENEEGKWTDVASERAEVLGREVGAQWRSLYKSLLPLMSGHQQQAYSFGKGLAQKADNRAELAERLAQDLAAIPLGKRNSTVLAAVLSVIDDDIPADVDAFAQRIADDASLSPSLAPVVRGIRLTDKRIGIVADALRRGRLAVEQLFGFSNGRAMANVSPNAAATLVDEMLTHGITGAWVALDVSYMYVYSDREKWTAFAPTIRKIIQTPQMLQKVGKHPLAGHSFEEVVARLLPGDQALADNLIDEILGAIGSKKADVYAHDHLFNSLFKSLLENHPGHAWLRLGRALIQGKGLTQWQLSDLLRNRLGTVGEGGLLNTIPDESLKQWCAEFPDKAPAVLAGMVQTIDRSKEDQPRLTPRVVWLLDAYGRQEAVLSALTANIHTFSWTGSLVPFYEMIAKAIEPVRDHKYAAVRKWADSNIRDAQRQIDRESARQMEHEVGRW